MLTRGSMVFESTLEQAKFMAECANLRLILAPWEYRQDHIDSGAYDAQYYSWEDRATGGGGCRITWYRGIAWVSCHSGYPQADITQDVSELFFEIGCKPVDNFSVEASNPRIYGIDRLDNARRQ